VCQPTYQVEHMLMLENGQCAIEYSPVFKGESATLDVHEYASACIADDLETYWERHPIVLFSCEITCDEHGSQTVVLGAEQ